MAERRSPLASLAHRGPEGGALRLSRITPGAILQVAAWPTTRASVEAVIGGLVGVRVPPVGRSTVGTEVAILATGPGRVLIACGAVQTAARLHRAIGVAEAAITDLSHGRVILRLEGTGAAAILAKGVAVDLDLKRFPAGQIAATVVDHIDVVIQRREAAVFDIWVLRGFAGALAEWLLDAGWEYGIGFDPG